MQLIDVTESRLPYQLSEEDVVKLMRYCGENVKRERKHPDYDDLFYFKFSEDNRGLETSYFVGMDWIKEGDLAISVRPKLESDAYDVDVLSMLAEALEDPENVNHLDGLLTIDFGRRPLVINKQDNLLSPFLLVLFIQVLKTIVSKGLKKGYHTKIESLRSKIKGKVRVEKNFRINTVKGKLTDQFCKFDEYGVDTMENRLLKKAFLSACTTFERTPMTSEAAALKTNLRQIRAAFSEVSDRVEISDVQTVAANPVHKEYKEAIKLAKLILRRQGYDNWNKESEGKSPPFWIDMSKLFELFVFKKLREGFPQSEVTYHFKAHYQELDFIVKKGKDNPPFIVDAKYKPRYKDNSVSKDDARQVAGYSRLERVYQELGVFDYAKNIRCLLIYPVLSANSGEEEIDCKNAFHEQQNGYVGIYKRGLLVPTIKKSQERHLIS